VGELSKQEKVCFVGDGINDLEALSSAHLSVAVLSSERGFGPTGSIHIPQDQVSNLLSWYRYFSKFERIEKWVILTGLSYNIALLAVNSTVGLSPFFVLLSFSAVSILSLSPLILLKRLSTHTVRKFSQT
jgi:P-type E1-E2 ATPase